MRRSHAQELLNKTVYAEGTSIQDHIKLLRTRRSGVDNLSTVAILDEAWRGIIIRSIPPTARWLPVIPSLYTLLTSADIISTLLAHGMILDQGNESKPTSNSSNTALVVRTNESCANPNCKAKKRSTHTTANCYWPGGGKEGQFPPNFGQRAKANAATFTAGKSDESGHFVLSAQAPLQDGQTTTGVILETDDELVMSVEISSTAFVSNGFKSYGPGRIPTFMDSGASDTMFVCRDDFVEYTPTALCTGDSAKAVDGNFDIVGEGRVVQCYLVEGKEKKITYTRALHTPTLNANLISISAFDKAGLMTTFSGGRGIISKPDGTVILTGRGDKGMYIVDALSGGTMDVHDVKPDTPHAMSSLSHPTSLEQWHRQLAHCSPATIQEMVSGNLVDGLNVSGMTLHGQCEDCILGRQTR